MAQTQRPPDPSSDVFVHFYKDPRPERLVGFFDGFRKSPGSQNWQAYPPVAGFFAVVFRAHQGWIEKLVPTQPDARIVEALAAALRLAGKPSKADDLRSKFKDAGTDEVLRAEFASLPTQLETLRVATPTHLDILWGAVFASGDARHVRTIIDFYAHTANLSEPIAIDVAQTVIAMTGGPQETLRGLRGKYGDEFARQIIYAAVALWAVQSNARQHPLVDQVVAKYIEERPGTPATKGLVVFRQRK